MCICILMVSNTIDISVTMGTHAIILLRERNKEGKFVIFCRLFIHYDGYLSVVGKRLLTFLTTVKFGQQRNDIRTAQGAGDLFAQLIVDFKKTSPWGNVYLEEPKETIPMDVEYVYYVDVTPKFPYGDEVSVTIYATYSKQGKIFQGSPQDALDRLEELDNKLESESSIEMPICNQCELLDSQSERSPKVIPLCDYCPKTAKYACGKCQKNLSAGHAYSHRQGPPDRRRH